MARYQATRDYTTAHSLLELFRLVNSKLLNSTLHYLPQGNPNKGFGLGSPLVSVFCLLTTLKLPLGPCVVWCGVSLFLRKYKS